FAGAGMGVEGSAVFNPVRLQGGPVQSSESPHLPTPESTYNPAPEQSVAAFIEAMCSRVNELLAAIPESSALPAAS
ncbi:MAG TPA: hypothetical protein VF493_23025, partial [Terriglobales bacterium]